MLQDLLGAPTHLGSALAASAAVLAILLPIVASAQSTDQFLFCSEDEQSEFRHGTPLVLNFSGFTSESERTPVDSDPQRFRLVNGYSCSQQGQGSVARPVIIEPPSGCSIGEVAVRDSDIVFVVDGEERKDLILATRMTATVLVRFKASGGYGRLRGAISCKQSGAFAVSF